MTGKELLDKFFDDVMKLDGDSQWYVWNILSALRGPDFVDRYATIKIATTAVIRYHVCRQLAASLGCHNNPGKLDREDLSPLLNEHSVHFHGHIFTAIDALEKLGYIS